MEIIVCFYSTSWNTKPSWNIKHLLGL